MAGENDSTETACLRQIAKEEIARPGDGHSNRLCTQSMYKQTQHLIRGAENTAVNELSQIQSQQVLATMPTTMPTTAPHESEGSLVDTKLARLKKFSWEV